jgi:phage terminase large subunit-like protein
MAGLFLDPWQEFVLTNSLGERSDGKWAAFEVGVEVSRQNGKGSILEARELTGLYLLSERLLVHSAHQFDTSLEAFRRLLFLIEDCPDLEQRVKRVSKSHGEEGIELKPVRGRPNADAQRIRFRTRTKGGGRGFTGDWLGLDEAMILPEAAHGALLPTLSARPNPQVWYCGSAVDQEIHPDGIVFARVRERALKGDDPRLAYFGWSVDAAHPEQVTQKMATDPAQWAQANPGFGIRISAEHIANEQRSMDPRTFAVERLGVGDWPRTDGMGGVVIDPEDWAALFDPKSEAEDPVMASFAYDVTPDRSRSAIGVAAVREDGLVHVEVIKADRGTGWVVPWFEERAEKYRDLKPVCDASGPAGSLLPDFQHAGIEVIPVNAKEHAQACGSFFDAVEQRALRHLHTAELADAVKGAVKRPLGDAWAWSRKNSGVDISPLVAVTLALWGVHAHQPKPKAAPRLINLAEV